MAVSAGQTASLEREPVNGNIVGTGRPLVKGEGERT